MFGPEPRLGGPQRRLGSQPLLPPTTPTNSASSARVLTLFAEVSACNAASADISVFY